MGKRAASLQPGCITVCLDRPVDSKPGVLCSIENIVANQKHVVDGLKSPAAKKQRCLELEQDPAAPKPLDVSFVFSKARSLLRQPPAGADDAPIGREKQSKQLEDLVTSFSIGSSGKSVYVSGLPGTGTPGSRRSAAKDQQAQTPSSRSCSSSRRHIVVLDEIDNLAKKSHADLVQLFLLPQQPGLRLLLIGIANSIDLTERALPELKLRMASPQLLCFPAYSTKQLGCILAACMEAIPAKLFEPAALDLCARSVGTSSGDLRHALKACRAAVDELERLHRQQQEQQQHDTSPSTAAAAAAAASAASAAHPTVTARVMVGALQRLASVRSSHFGAQAASCIRALPNQQQLLLYSLSVLCRPREVPADAADGQQKQQQCGRTAPASTAAAAAGSSSLWKAVGSALAHSSGSKKGAAKKLGGSASGSSSPSSRQVFVLSVALDDAYAQYRQVCKLLSLPACSRAELQHMAELLSQMALVDILRSPAAGSGGGGGSIAGLGGGLKAGRAGGRGGLGGLGGLGGGRGLLAGGASKLGGGGAKAGAGGSTAGGFGVGVQQSGEVRLSLRPSAAEVEAALQHNPALRCLVQK
ncbi:hypothetical protein COO60DRAFT_1672110 [Scenedesmus sp. NREL 46B-D3]|nr:hypothetical protein COO60DRAFT_1672110 [Scenedesmus sp. NREL 46B-D3]